MSNDLKTALATLYAERDQLQAEFDRISERMNLLNTGIDAVRKLIGNETVTVDEHLLRIEAQARAAEHDAIDSKPPALHVLIQNVLSDGPKSIAQIASTLIADGYQTSSKDFANVVGTNLRQSSNKHRFRRTEDGRWMLANLELAAAN